MWMGRGSEGEIGEGGGGVAVCGEGVGRKRVMSEKAKPWELL